MKNNLLFLVLFLIPFNLFGQTHTVEGTLSGINFSTIALYLDNIVVELSIDGVPTRTTTIDSGGKYTFNSIPAGSDVTIRPIPNTDCYNILFGCLNITDLVQLKEYIRGDKPFLSPFPDRIAADLNGDKIIDDKDIDVLISFLIGDFGEYGCYRFFDADYSFTPSNPETQLFPQSISIPNISSNWVKNFSAVKLGEMDDCLPSGVGSFLKFYIGNATATSGQRVTIPVTIGTFEDVMAFQFSLNWNPDILSFVRVKNFGIPELSIGTTRTTIGELVGAWHDPTFFGIDLSDMDGKVLFEMEFDVIGTSPHTAISFSNSPIIPSMVKYKRGTTILETSSIQTGDGVVTINSDPNTPCNAGSTIATNTFSTIITSPTDTASPTFGYSESGISGIRTGNEYVIMGQSSAPKSGFSGLNTQFVTLNNDGEEVSNFINEKVNTSTNFINDFPKQMMESFCSEEGYIVTGYSGNTEVIFEKISPSNTVIFSHSFTSNENLKGAFIAEQDNGDLLIGGTSSNGFPKNLFFAFGNACTNPTPTAFLYDFGENFFPEAATAIKLGSPLAEYYAITGRRAVTGQLFMLVVDKSGNIVFGDLLPISFGSASHYGYDILQKNNGDIAILGQYNNKIFILELRYENMGNTFEVVQSKLFDVIDSDIETANAFVINNDGNYVISGTGFSSGINNSPTRGIIMEINETDLSVKWANKYIADNFDYSSFSDITLANNGYFCVGAIGNYHTVTSGDFSFLKGINDIYAIKTDENGLFYDCDCMEEITVSTSNLTPSLQPTLTANRTSLSRIDATYTSGEIRLEQDFCDQFSCTTLPWSTIDFDVSYDTTSICDDNDPVITIIPQINGGFYPDSLNYDLDCDGIFELTGKSWSDQITHNFGGPGTYDICIRGQKILDGVEVCDTTWTVSVQIEICPESIYFNCGKAVATCFPGFINNLPSAGINTNSPVLGIVDIRDRSGVTPGSYWSAQSGSNIHHPPHWNYNNLGLVFGLAIDADNNIYTSSTTVYGCSFPNGSANSPFGPSNLSRIYKIDPSDNISVFIEQGPFDGSGTGNTIPSNDAGFGNIVYDSDHDQFFVTNMHDGMIYRIKGGMVVDRFDPFGTTNLPSSSNPGFVELGERIWGIGYHNNKVYFSRWRQDRGHRDPLIKNEIWSVDLTFSGTFNSSNTTSTNTYFDSNPSSPSTSRLEILLPNHIDYDAPSSFKDYSNPISDIAFTINGRMLLAERSMFQECGNASNRSLIPFTAHQSRVLEYEMDHNDWQLTFGHGNEPFTDYSSDLKYFIQHGYNRTGSNSGGGIDYGYKNFNPNSNLDKLVCDDMIWASADYQIPMDSDRIYGMVGMSTQKKANSSNGYLIDYDGEISTTWRKIQQGDVEIFKCGCYESPINCNDLSANARAISLIEDNSCCYAIDLTNNVGQAITKVEIELLTDGWLLQNPMIHSDLVYAELPMTNKISLRDTTSGSIPIGILSDAVELCLDTLPNQSHPLSQYLVVRWFEEVEEDCEIQVCTDTLMLNCDPNPPTPCLELIETSVVCNPDNAFEYFLNFKVKNNSLTNAGYVKLESQSNDFSFSSCNTSNPTANFSIILAPFPILPESTSNTLCAKIISNKAILSPTDICFNIGLFDSDFTSCCHSVEEVCVTLETCCNLCEDKSIIVEDLMVDDPFKSCCKKIDITNDCPYPVFTKIEAAILTPGVRFGYAAVGGPQGTDWNITNASDTNIVYTPIFNQYIGNGIFDDLIQFCLDDINDSSEQPQQVVLNWYGQNENGLDSLICVDTINMNCDRDFECLTISDSDISCDEINEKYNYTFTVTNESTIPFAATQVNVLIDSPAGLEFDSTGVIGVYPLSPPLQKGASRTINAAIKSTTGTFPINASEMVFKTRLAFEDEYGIELDTCCFENVLDTLQFTNCTSNPIDSMGVKLVGDSLANHYHEIKQVGGFIYAVGQTGTDSIYGIFSKFDLSGNIIWTVQLDATSILYDFVPIDEVGSAFLLVGRTDPSIINTTWQDNQSILCHITNSGTIDWTRQYNQQGRESMFNIVKAPNPTNQAFPFYISGVENSSASPSTYDIVNLYNLDANGLFNWKQQYDAIPSSSNYDNEFIRSLSALSSGNLALFGIVSSATGYALWVDGNGVPISSFNYGQQHIINDAVHIPGTNDYYIVGEIRSNGNALIARIDSTGNDLWSYELNKQQVFTKIHIAQNGSLYAIGKGIDDNGINRYFLNNFNESSNSLQLNWTRYIDGEETAYHIASFDLTENDYIIYTDGRLDNPSGYGDYDALIGIFDADFSSDCTKEFTDNLINFAFLNNRIASVHQNTSTINLTMNSNGQTIAFECIEACSSSCLEEDIIHTNQSNAAGSFITNGKIESTIIVETGMTTYYQAKESVSLMPGFEAKSGSAFHAVIEDCENQLQEETPTQEYHINPAIKTDKLQRTESVISVYPNPTSASFRVVYTIENTQEVNIYLADFSGRIVKSYNLNTQDKGTHYQQIDFGASFSQGLYYVILQTESGILTEKVIYQ